MNASIEHIVRERQLLDLGSLSPTLKGKIAEEVFRVSLRESSAMERDIESYGPGSTRDEMLEWQKAAKEVSKQAYNIWRGK